MNKKTKIIFGMILLSSILSVMFVNAQVVFNPIGESENPQENGDNNGGNEEEQNYECKTNLDCPIILCQCAEEAEECECPVNVCIENKCLVENLVKEDKEELLTEQIIEEDEKIEKQNITKQKTFSIIDFNLSNLLKKINLWKQGNLETSELLNFVLNWKINKLGGETNE